MSRFLLPLNSRFCFSLAFNSFTVIVGWGSLCVYPTQSSLSFLDVQIKGLVKFLKFSAIICCFCHHGIPITCVLIGLLVSYRSLRLCSFLFFSFFLLFRLDNFLKFVFKFADAFVCQFESTVDPLQLIFRFSYYTFQLQRSNSVFCFFFNNLFVEILYSLNHCHHALLSVL